MIFRAWRREGDDGFMSGEMKEGRAVGFIRDEMRLWRRPRLFLEGGKVLRKVLIVFWKTGKKTKVRRERGDDKYFRGSPWRLVYHLLVFAIHLFMSLCDDIFFVYVYFPLLVNIFCWYNFFSPSVFILSWFVSSAVFIYSLYWLVLLICRVLYLFSIFIYLFRFFVLCCVCF